MYYFLLNHTLAKLPSPAPQIESEGEGRGEEKERGKGGFPFYDLKPPPPTYPPPSPTQPRLFQTRVLFPLQSVLFVHVYYSKASWVQCI